ncbi:MAG: hypothetical protein FWC89_08175, partial [Defluviitaleaceae bacterium]|nr:hypothetical protein [Defluviitaleaceae bacterium]
MKNFAKKSVAIMLASILITAGISGCVGFNAVYYESSQLIAQEQIGQIYNEAINLQTLNEDNDAFYYASHSVNNAPTQISPEFAEQPNLYTYESKISAARIEFEPKPTPLPEPILTPTPRIATNTSITGEWHHINEERDFRFRIEFIRPNTVIYYAGWYYQWAARADG